MKRVGSPRVLFVAPHSVSSGEAITGMHAAEDVRAGGGTTHFVASPHTARFLDGRQPGGVTVLGGGDREANQAIFGQAVHRFKPEIVIFCDYAVLHVDSGGVPLVDDGWIEGLDDLDADLVTFDHLGLEQPSPEAAVLRRLAHPARMKVLLPCPLHEPAPLADRVGIPFRQHRQPAPRAESSIRSALVPGAGGYLVLHAVSSWEWKMAEIEGSAFFALLPALLEHYFGNLPLPVTVVSVNRGDLLPPPPLGRIQIVNLAPLPVDRFESLLAASDLFMTENCFSASLGKAICADVPAVAWRNSFGVEDLLARITGDSPPAILDAALHGPAIVSPWVAFPWWPPDIEKGLTVLDRNSIAAAFTPLEIFDAARTTDTVRRLLLDEPFRETLAAARRQYAEKVAHLPGCHEAVRQAVSSSIRPGAAECPPPISSC